MNDDVLETIEETQLSRRGLLVKGGLAAAGLTALGTPAATALAAGSAGTIKIAVVTHGDTGAVWSVFKRVDDPGREGRHPGHEGEGAGGVQGRQVARRVPRPRPGRHDPLPRRPPLRDEGRHVRRRRSDQGDSGGANAVRDRPAAVPAGIP